MPKHLEINNYTPTHHANTTTSAFCVAPLHNSHKCFYKMDFLIEKKNLKHGAAEAAPALSLGDGEVLLRVDFFALTANNITYVRERARKGKATFPPIFFNDVLRRY